VGSLDFFSEKKIHPKFEFLVQQNTCNFSWVVFIVNEKIPPFLIRNSIFEKREKDDFSKPFR